jgi:hypothetical protein
MPRRTLENAQTDARLARPLSSFTPAQRRLLLALIEAGTPTPPPRPLRAKPAPDRRCGPSHEVGPTPRPGGDWNRSEPECTPGPSGDGNRNKRE